jgi:hypothetical protein
MSPRAFAELALVLLLAATAAGCGGEDRARADAPSARAAVVGTVLDRATGMPIAGARVTLPGGRTAETDERGRFEVRDLDPGLAGSVVVRTGDGRTASIELRPLRPAPLEIVLHAGT